MKLICTAVLLAVVCLAVYWPHKKAQFILDDYYTVVRNPLIKNPQLYPKIWTSRLFDAHQSSGYIKFGYYRPVLQSSWIVDYRLFGLKAYGYQWLNLLIHALNCLLVYILILRLFGKDPLALKTCFLFCVLPTQEWVVRYVTGRGDELSTLFALASLLAFLWVLRSGTKKGYILVFIFWALAAMTREVAVTYFLYAILLNDAFFKNKDINRFSLYWVLIGTLPFILIWHIIPKQGNILVFHVFYFASIGLCLWMAQLRLRWFLAVLILFCAVSFYQGRFWTSEEVLLRHTRSLEFWPGTVADQQLLMKYDDDIPAIKGMADRPQEPLIKAMWLRRLGVVYFQHRDLSQAQDYLTRSLSVNPANVDTLDALAVVSHFKGDEYKSLEYLERSLKINPAYPDTLRTIGIYYYIHKDYPRSRYFLSRCLFFEPGNHQAQDLLRLANQMN